MKILPNPVGFMWPKRGRNKIASGTSQSYIRIFDSLICSNWEKQEFACRAKMMWLAKVGYNEPEV